MERYYENPEDPKFARTALAGVVRAYWDKFQDRQERRRASAELFDVCTEHFNLGSNRVYKSPADKYTEALDIQVFGYGWVILTRGANCRDFENQVYYLHWQNDASRKGDEEDAVLRSFHLTKHNAETRDRESTVISPLDWSANHSSGFGEKLSVADTEALTDWLEEMLPEAET